jgi:hypothetical protein
VQLAQHDTIRLVSSARLREASLAPLVDDEDEYQALVALEYATHGRLEAQASGLADLDPKELVFGVPCYTFINAAFCYPRPGGNRFNDENRGAWYCGFDIKTSLDEVIYHLTRALRDAGTFFNTTDYAELFADFIGAFQDLRSERPRPVCLDPDISVGYPAGQVLAKFLRDERKVSGIVYPSVRRPAGVCLVALYPAVVQNVRQGGLWRVTWAGKPQPTVVKDPTT